MLPRVITHTENEVFDSLQKRMLLFNLIGLVVEPHVFHRRTLLSCDCLHDQRSNGLASGISRVAQRCSYEGRGRTVRKVDSVHVDGKHIERTLVEGTTGVVECAECPRHSVAIKVSHRFVEKGLSFCFAGALRSQRRTTHREHENNRGVTKHCLEFHGTFPSWLQNRGQARTECGTNTRNCHALGYWRPPGAPAARPTRAS